MISKLNQELTAALREVSDREPEVIAPGTSRTYMLVDRETHRQAMDALRWQQDRDAIADGLAEVEAGQGTPLDVAFAGMRSRLGLPAAEADLESSAQDATGSPS